MARVRRIRPDDEIWLRENYASKTIDQCIEHLGVSARTIFRWASSLGLPSRREVHAPAPKRYYNGPSVYRKTVLVNKCCYLCEKYKKADTCEIVSLIDTYNACKMVCWDFEIRKELEAND